MRPISLMNYFISFIAGGAMFVMALIGAADIAGRVAGRPVAGAYEITETLMVIVIFLGIAMAEEQNRHVSVSLLANLLPENFQIILRSFGSLISGFLFLLIAYFGWSAALRSIATGELQAGEIGFPLGPARLILALGASMMVLQCLVKILDDIRKLVGAKP